MYSSLKRAGCCKRPVQNSSYCSQSSQKHPCSALLDFPVKSLDVCLVFPPLILVSCAALCLAEVWVINPMWRQASCLCFLTCPSLTSQTAVFTAFSLSSLSWSDITQLVEKKDAPWKYHICTATQNSVLLGQYMPFSETHSFGEPSSSASAKGKVLLPNILLWQHRRAFSLTSSVNRKGRGRGSEAGGSLHLLCKSCLQEI